MNKRYVIRDREAGNEIADFDDLEIAERQLWDFEEEDKRDNSYTENFYEIYDRQKEEIII